MNEHRFTVEGLESNVEVKLPENTKSLGMLVGCPLLLLTTDQRLADMASKVLQAAWDGNYRMSTDEEIRAEVRAALPRRTFWDRLLR